MIRQNPKEHEIYRHIEGTLYQIMAVAEHAKSKEQMVVYRNLYEPSEIYTMPLSQFMDEVDHLSEEHLSEDTSPDDEPFPIEVQIDSPEKEEELVEEEVNPLLLRFLDMRTYKDKLELLTGMRDRVDDEMLNAIAMSLDLELLSETVEEKYEEVKNCLMMMVKFECDRLR